MSILRAAVESCFQWQERPFITPNLRTSYLGETTLDSTNGTLAKQDESAHAGDHLMPVLRRLDLWGQTVASIASIALECAFWLIGLQLEGTPVRIGLR